ncbi:MAG: ion transporter [Cyclobacteriaceae bacterium]|nr:ion transporter [Cyclobacteriaceae bacterium]
MKHSRTTPKSDDTTELRRKLFEIIFKADTLAGKAFDLLLLVFIIVSVVSVTLETIPGLDESFKKQLFYAEWLFTIIFSIEYVARIYSLKKPGKYIFSFFGIIDFLAILPSYITLIYAGSQYFVVLRVFRLLRVFKILRMVEFLGEAEVLRSAVKASLPKIFVFLITVFCIVIIMGTIIYKVEGPENGFTSIPMSMYWTIVTLTTVGYGDIVPKTASGQLIASILMIVGYGLIAVPTGIVTANLTQKQQSRNISTTTTCTACGSEEHTSGAKFCKDCGQILK